MMRRIVNLHGGRRGVLALVATAAGLALIGWAWQAQVSAPQPRPQGRISVATRPSPGHSGTAKPADGAAQEHTSSPGATDRPRSQDSAPLGPSRPVRISIPAIDVHSKMFPIG